MTEKHAYPDRNIQFRHAPETIALCKQRAAELNISYPEFIRQAFNAGLKVQFGIELFDNRPIVEKAA